MISIDLASQATIYRNTVKGKSITEIVFLHQKKQGDLKIHIMNYPGPGDKYLLFMYQQIFIMLCHIITNPIIDYWNNVHDYYIPTSFCVCSVPLYMLTREIDVYYMSMYT